jgi:hypothetical protein
MKKFMNFFLMAAMVAFCVGFSSCSEDDDEGENSKKEFSKLIVGKWKYYAYAYEGWHEVDRDVYVQFNADGSFSSSGNYADLYPLSSFKTWEHIGEGYTIYGKYGDGQFVDLTVNDYVHRWDVCIVGKDENEYDGDNYYLEIEGYDYPDIMAVADRNLSIGSTQRWVRVK